MIKNSIVVLIILLSTPAIANNEDIADRSFEQRVQQYVLESSLYQLEQKLIKDYLKEAFQNDVVEETSQKIKIYNASNKLVYQGELKNAKDLKQKISPLFNFEKTQYYLINQ